MSSVSAKSAPKQKTSVFNLIVGYRKLVIWLIILGIIANGLTLYLPALISKVIDAYESVQLICDTYLLSLVFFGWYSYFYV